MNNPYVGIVVVNFRTSSLVADLLRSLSTLPGATSARVCVVDNSLDSGEFTAITALCSAVGHAFANAIAVAAPSNLGYGLGNNFGYMELASRFGAPAIVVIANPDTAVTGGNLDDLLGLVDSNAIWVAEAVGGLHGSRALVQLKRPTARIAPISAREGSPRKLIYPQGHFLVIPGGVWQAVDGFSPDYFLYCEEIDLALRVDTYLGGARSRVLGGMQVIHRGGASTCTPGIRPGKKSLVTMRQSTRSRVILYRTHRRLRRWLVPMVLTRFALAVTTLLRGDMRGAVAIAVGLRDGLSHNLGRYAATSVRATNQRSEP